LVDDLQTRLQEEEKISEQRRESLDILINDIVNLSTQTKVLQLELDTVTSQHLRENLDKAREDACNARKKFQSLEELLLNERQKSDQLKKDLRIVREELKTERVTCEQFSKARKESLAEVERLEELLSTEHQISEKFGEAIREAQTRQAVLEKELETKRVTSKQLYEAKDEANRAQKEFLKERHKSERLDGAREALLRELGRVSAGQKIERQNSDKELEIVRKELNAERQKAKQLEEALHEVDMWRSTFLEEKSKHSEINIKGGKSGAGTDGGSQDGPPTKSRKLGRTSQSEGSILDDFRPHPTTRQKRSRGHPRRSKKQVIKAPSPRVTRAQARNAMTKQGTKRRHNADDEVIDEEPEELVQGAKRRRTGLIVVPTSGPTRNLRRMRSC
jgi:hypothetical protein